MCLIGCTPPGRHIEQHDIFFGIASTAKELIEQMAAFWPDGGRLHLDSWRKVTYVDHMKVEVVEKTEAADSNVDTLQNNLYFINLGGYQPATFDELHHKLITIQPDKAGAIQCAKSTSFYQQAQGTHVDDQYGVDIDDLYNVEDILPAAVKEKYSLRLTKNSDLAEIDRWHIGYTKLELFATMF